MSIHLVNNSPDFSPSCSLALLGFLRREPSYGYEIYQRLNRSDLRDIWRLKQSRLYAMLARLEAAGLLWATAEPGDGRPPRKVFHLTEAGANAFRDWLEQPVGHPRDVRLEFMLKLYFAVEAGGETAAQLIARQQATGVIWLRERRAASGGAFSQAVAAYRQAHIEAIVNWLDGLAA